MNTAFIFFIAVIIAIISVLPPGLLNISAAKISLEEGRTRGLLFSAGAALVVILQTYVAAIFARYLNRHPEIIEILRIIALVVFIGITIYFLLLAKTEKKELKEPKIKSKKSSFFYGMLLSVLNVFPVPYQAYMTTTLAGFGWLNFSQKSIISYMSGVGVGSFLTFYMYILFFKKIKHTSLTSKKNMNIIIGSITGIISVITLINIVKDYI